MLRNTILQRARDVMDIEMEGLSQVRNQLGEPFFQLAQRCLDTLAKGGKLVLCGIGKSGHIGQKLAATLSSTGSTAVFLHPVEAMHGDLGVLSGTDLLIALSYSGETDELLHVLPAAKLLGVPIVAITGSATSSLARLSGLTVPMPVPREACPFNLAPTTSTTALLALGDALAIALLECRDFSAEDYAKLHPSGAIGRSITLRVADIMRAGERLAKVGPDACIRDALFEMTRAKAGSVAVVNAEERLLGIFTDGDFRRHITTDANLLEMPIGQVMTPNPITVRADAMAVEVMRIFEQRRIDDILVVDEGGRVQGIVDVQDMQRFKLM